jgi:hypothetical protein
MVRREIAPKQKNKKRVYEVKGYCKEFYEHFVNPNLGELEKELIKEEKRIWAFLKGFYESEGSVDFSRTRIRIFNTIRSS